MGAMRHGAMGGLVDHLDKGAVLSDVARLDHQKAVRQVLLRQRLQIAFRIIVRPAQAHHPLSPHHGNGRDLIHQAGGVCGQLRRLDVDKTEGIFKAVHHTQAEGAGEFPHEAFIGAEKQENPDFRIAGLEESGQSATGQFHRLNALRSRQKAAGLSVWRRQGRRAFPRSLPPTGSQIPTAPHCRRRCSALIRYKGPPAPQY